MSQWGYGYTNQPMQYSSASKGIPENQLEIWSHQGAITSAANTHASIRIALEGHDWGNVTYDPYLQGSYRNDTNIRANSDVDLAIELTSVYYDNLTEAEKKQVYWTPASYSWSQFKNDVISVLTAYFGSKYIDISGSKSIKVLPNNNRLKADVVVCAHYRYYKNLRVRADGMIFWTSAGEEIINYPKLHYENGVKKNSAASSYYKPAIRMFKNAREKIVEGKTALAGRFPSYFIECLLFNVPDSKFSSSFRNTYYNVTNWLENALTNDSAKEMVCQNWMYYLFGPYSVQWNLADAKLLVLELKELWNKW